MGALHIVIPGGTGFLGRHLTDRLTRRGDRVTILTRGAPASGPGWDSVTWDARGDGPLEWENAWREASETTSRRVLLRAGIAIGGAGDPASGRLLALARWGLGGRVGSGEQWVSWIALEDFMSVLVGAVVDDTMTGTYSVASPNPVQNTEMMAAYREAAGRSWGLPSPTLVTRIGARLLRSDPALALTGRRVVPSRLLAEGFAFETPDFREAVHRAIGP